MCVAKVAFLCDFLVSGVERLRSGVERTSKKAWSDFTSELRRRSMAAFASVRGRK